MSRVSAVQGDPQCASSSEVSEPLPSREDFDRYYKEDYTRSKLRWFDQVAEARERESREIAEALSQESTP